MMKFLTTLAVLGVFATPAFAQSFDPDNGTGNVPPFSHKPTASHNDKIAVSRSGLGSFAMVPGPRSAHVTPHKEGAAQTQVSREGIFEFYGIGNTSVPGASIDKDDTTPNSK
jgi:hypothetical protein